MRTPKKFASFLSVRICGPPEPIDALDTVPYVLLRDSTGQLGDIFSTLPAELRHSVSWTHSLSSQLEFLVLAVSSPPKGR